MGLKEEGGCGEDVWVLRESRWMGGGGKRREMNGRWSRSLRGGRWIGGPAPKRKEMDGRMYWS